MGNDERGPAYPLWERVMQELDSRGWTQTQLQSEAGVHRTTVDAWRHQPKPPRPATVKAVAVALSIPHDEAFRLAGYPAGRIPKEVPSDTSRPAPPGLADLVMGLREEAEERGTTIGELLVEYGLADPDDLAVPDALPPDPIIAELESSTDLSDETKATLIRLHLENRARRFEEARQKRKKPGS